jgi:hypothetical protein
MIIRCITNACFGGKTCWRGVFGVEDCARVLRFEPMLNRS